MFIFGSENIKKIFLIYKLPNKKLLEIKPNIKPKGTFCQHLHFFVLDYFLLYIQTFIHSSFNLSIIFIHIFIH